MPEINKQRAPAKPNGKPVPKPAKKTGSVLDRITPVDEVVTGFKMLIYGRTRTGKTRLACSFPKPLLLIGTEDGTHTVRKVPGVDFIRLERGEEMDDLVGLLKDGKSYWVQQGGTWRKLPKREGAPYVTGVLDHATGFQSMLLKEVLGLVDEPITRSWGMAQYSDWQAVGAQFIERTRGLFDLADQGEFNALILAHDRDFGKKTEGGEDEPAKPSEIVVPKMGANVTPMAATWLHPVCDYVCYSFIRPADKEAKVSKVAGKEVSLSQYEYGLWVGPHNTFMTGFRLRVGQTLPDVILDPTYEKIIEVINGETE